MEDLIWRTIEEGRSLGARYIDLRAQNFSILKITIQNGLVEKIESGVISGVGVRVLVNGAWGFSSMCKLSQEDYLNTVQSAVKLAKGGDKTDKKIELAEIKCVQERVPLKQKIDARNVSIEEKVNDLLSFNKSASGYDKRIVTASTSYLEAYDHTIFASSEGSLIEEENPRLNVKFSVGCKSDGEMRWANGAKSASKGYEFLDLVDFHKLGEETSRRAVEHLGSKPTPSGKLSVVMSPDVVGLFVHEAFGHSDEADSILQGRSFLAGMLGKKIASDEFTIYSDPTRNEGTGFYKYDSEGTPGRKVALIKNGVFKSYMHSRESAATCGVKPTGNARAQDYSYDPIIRMNNLYVDNRDWKFEEIIEDTKYGILTMASGGGMEDPERGGFQFNVGSCYLIEAGEVTAPLRDTSLSGATLEAFMGVDAVGNEFELWGGTCGKGEPSMQMVMNSNGGSTIRVNSIIVGGSA